ncbi:hypothetical protein [Peribacillus kribbensis]|nr:hypothetical protein [Peribacillus kribbensis]
MELIGCCRHCLKEIYCRDGFLEGYVDKDGGIICFSCEQKNVSSKD